MFALYSVQTVGAAIDERLGHLHFFLLKIYPFFHPKILNSQLCDKNFQYWTN